MKHSQTTKEDVEPTSEVNERASKLFKLMVEEYLADGYPVGSKLIAQKSGLHISSATVRNVMSHLESKGLVSSPHTSAGKVPTNRGLRFFVDSLISVEPLDLASQHFVRDSLQPDLSPSELIESASSLLSEVSSLVGLVTTPRPEQLEFRHIDFLQLSGNRVLAIFVVNEREVQNRVIETDQSYSDIELNQAANFINQEFAGRTLLDIRSEILESMRSDQSRMNELMQTALDVASKTFEQDDEDVDHDFVVTGERNLVSLLTSSEEVQLLLDAFRNKSNIVHLLDRCIFTEGVQLYIGGESGYAPLDDYTLISTKYEVDGAIAGALGVIGPTRMQYQKVIPLVDITARLLGTALEQAHA